MIIVQTPLRVSLFGGGTDFRSFYEVEGGCVLTTAIDKYIFVIIKKRFDRKLRVGYTRTEMVDSVEEVEHELIRESFRKTGISQGVEIDTMGDIPSAGSGLGSSSTVTVGALNAMHHLLGHTVTQDVLAKEACEIEIDILKKPIGIQDQYIAAFGGFRFLEFKPDGQVVVDRVHLSDDSIRLLNDNLMLFYTGINRKSEDVLFEQNHHISRHFSILCEMKDMAYIARDELQKGNLDVLGEMLHKSWLLKKQLGTKISNGIIEEIYQAALRGGAIGGKISGAGGGGYLLLYCPYERQSSVREALRNLQELPFRLEYYGSKVIFDYAR